MVYYKLKSNSNRSKIQLTFIILLILISSIFLSGCLNQQPSKENIKKKYSIEELYQSIPILEIDQEKLFHDHENWKILTDFENDEFFSDGETKILSYNSSVVLSGNRSLEIEIPADGTTNVLTNNKTFCFDPRKHYFRINIYTTKDQEEIGLINRVCFKTDNYNFYVFDIPKNDLKKEEWVEVVCNRWYIVGYPDPKNISSFQIQFSSASDNNVKIYIDKFEILDPIFKNGAVTLTFDDAQISHYTKIFPLMKKYDFRGVEGYTHSFPEMTDFQMKEMQEYGWDIVNHGWEHKNQRGSSKEDIEYDILRMMMYLKNQDFNGWRFFFAPYGEMIYSDLMKSYSIFSRGIYYTNGEGSNAFPPVNSFLNCKMIINSTTVEEIKNLINNTIERGEWLILLWHGLDKDGYESWPSTYFDLILEFIDTTKIQVITMDEAWSNINKYY